jgi:hypothetical protein
MPNVFLHGIHTYNRHATGCCPCPRTQKILHLVNLISFRPQVKRCEVICSVLSGKKSYSKPRRFHLCTGPHSVPGTFCSFLNRNQCTQFRILVILSAVSNICRVLSSRSSAPCGGPQNTTLCQSSSHPYQQGRNRHTSNSVLYRCLFTYLLF